MPGAGAPGGAPGAKPGGAVGGPGNSGVKVKLGSGKKLEEGAPEDVVQKVVNAILSGDVSAVSDLMSKKAKGVAGAIKSGDDEHKDFDKLKAALEEATINEAKPVGSRKLVLVEGKKKKKIQFFVVREGSEQVVDEIKGF